MIRDALSLFSVKVSWFAILNVDETDVVQPEVDAERNGFDTSFEDLQQSDEHVKPTQSTKTVQQCAAIPDEEQGLHCQNTVPSQSKTIALIRNVQLCT